MERHNVQATPFDLALLTAALDKPIPNRRAYYRQVYEQLIERIKLFRKTNERLAENPELANIRLKVPLTQAIFAQLRQIPSWAQANQDHNRSSIGDFAYRCLPATSTIAGQSHQYRAGWPDCRPHL